MMMSTWSRLFFWAGSFSAAETRSRLAGVIVHEVGDAQQAARRASCTSWKPVAGPPPANRPAPR